MSDPRPPTPAGQSAKPAHPHHAEHSRDLLITAGPTHEPIDAVRYLANRSSGRLGIALTDAAARRGWSTTLLLGPATVPVPDSSRVDVHRFRTTADLADLLQQHWPNHRILIMAAAVADYRPANPTSQQTKLPRRTERLTLELEPTPDLLADLASITRPDQYTVGFALEPADQLEDKARRKLTAKHLDAIVANPLETMESDRIEAHLYETTDGHVAPAHPMSKTDFADWLLDRLAKHLTAQP